MPTNNNGIILENVLPANNPLPNPVGIGGAVIRLTNDTLANDILTSVGATPFLINGVPSVNYTIAAGATVQFQSDNTRWVLISIPGLVFPTVTSPVRALNSVFTPHATRPVLGLYTVSIGGTTTLLSGDDGRIRLRSDLGVPATIRVSARNRVFQGLGVTVGTNSVLETELSFLIPAGWSVDLSTEVLVAAPVFTLVRSTEIIL